MAQNFTQAMNSLDIKEGTSGAVQEYVVRVQKNTNKKFNIMQFNGNLAMDFGKWSSAKMERENNLREYKSFDDDIPKFGAGSEYGREQKEEARRKKYGYVSKKYNADDQPWLLKVGGKTGRKYRGTREGGISENASYYVFMQSPDGSFEAHPIQEWYSFQPVQKYKALSAEQAEEEFGRRDKVLNYFSIMVKNRLKSEDANEGTEKDKRKETAGKYGRGKGELKISEMDEWMDSDEQLEDSESGSDAEKKPKNNKKGKKKPAEKTKKKKKGSGDEASEDSDDGDEEGRELDYISDSSESSGSDLDGKTKDDMKGVAEEDALKKLLNSDESEEDEEKKSNDEENGDDQDENKNEDGEGEDGKKAKKRKKKKLKKGSAAGNKDKDLGLSSEGSDDEAKKNGLTNLKQSNSRSGTPTSVDSPNSAGQSAENALKRKGFDAAGSSKTPVIKKPKSDVVSPPIPFGVSSESLALEESVRRYLLRKPMTTTELLQKLKSKKTGLSSEQLVNMIAQILKRVNPVKQTIKGKMYLSLKAT